MKRLLMGLLFGSAISFATLCVLEGAASALLFFRDYRSATASKALIRPYTTHDTLLGWVNRPTFTSPDEYGKGIGLTTTSLGVRGDGTGESAPTSTGAGLVCSGDSYTMGTGVSDDRTWCAALGRSLRDVRTYNMGQADYGLDQSILRYQRDGALVPHQTHVLGITNAQLERMTTESIGGRFKPMLAVEGNALVRRNVPVPVTTMESLRAASRERVKYDLRVVQALGNFVEVDSRARAAHRIDGEWALVEQSLDDVALGHRSHRTRFLIVYLPVKRDLKPGSIDQRRRKLSAYAQRRGIEFLDLTMPMRAMRPDSLDLAFISRVPRGAAPGVVTQYSNLGNAWIAQKIADQLRIAGAGGTAVSLRELPRRQAVR